MLVSSTVSKPCFFLLFGIELCHLDRHCPFYRNSPRFCDLIYHRFDKVILELKMNVVSDWAVMKKVNQEVLVSIKDEGIVNMKSFSRGLMRMKDENMIWLNS